jgi:hypothetical protein
MSQNQSKGDLHKHIFLGGTISLSTEGTMQLQTVEYVEWMKEKQFKINCQSQFNKNADDL